MISCLRDCSGRGTCNLQTGICNCEPASREGFYYSSPDCALTKTDKGAFYVANLNFGVMFWIAVVVAMLWF